MKRISFISLPVILTTLFTLILFFPEHAGAWPGKEASCNSCHTASDSDATISTFIDGTATSSVSAGNDGTGSFEIDWYFTDITQTSSYGVGVEIVVPSGWIVASGTSSYSPTGWNSAWDAADGVGWSSSYDTHREFANEPDGYTVNFDGSNWEREDSNRDAACDNGGSCTYQSDQDSTSEKMGADAVITVPNGTSTGTYTIRVFGVGHNESDQKAAIESTITVTVTGGSNSRYWVCSGNGDVWSDSNCWSTSSGGSGGAGAPSSTQIAVFDSNSGNKGVTLDQNVSIVSIDMKSGNSCDIDTDAASDYSITLSGDLSVKGGSFDINGSTITVSGIVNFTGGALTSDADSDWIFDGTTLLTSSGESLNNVQLGTASKSGSLTLLDNADFSALTVMNGGSTTLTITDMTLNFSGSSMDLTNLDTFNSTGSTVIFDGTTDQTITSNGFAFNIVTLNNTGSAGNDDIILADDMDVNGNFTITNGDFNPGSYTVNVAGDWTNNSTMTAGTSTIILDGTSQTVYGDTTFYNLTKSVSTADTLSFDFASEQTITNTLILKGVSGQLLTLTCTGCAAEAEEKWNITLQSGGEQVLQYLSVYKSDAGGGVTLEAAASTNAGQNINWDFSPTSVELVSFDAIGMDEKALLTWKTASEIDNAGFNLYRSTEINGTYERINPLLIPGLINSAMGRTYEYTDSPVTNGGVYYYKLEDIDLKGRSTMHGPVKARPGLDSDGDGMTDDWELYYGLAPHDPSDNSLDPDGDGKTNLEEFLEGTDPSEDESSEEYSAEAGLKILESNNRHIVMELTTPSFETADKVIKGQTYQTLTIPDYIHGYTEDGGSPQMPAKAALISVPKNARLQFRILETETDVLKGTYEKIIPVPTAVEYEEGILTDEHIRDEEVYARDSLYPDAPALVFRANELRKKRLSRVVFHPLQHNPVQGTLLLNKRIRAEILFTHGKGKKKKNHAPPALPDTGNPRVRISLKEEGMYKLGWHDLFNAGLENLDNIDPRNFTLYHRGQKIPIYVEGEQDGWFDEEDRILFYGEALQSKYSSTNIYWLTYGEETGLRMSENTGSMEDPVAVPAECMSYTRWENDEFYWTTLEGTDETDRWFYLTFVWGGTQGDFPLSLSGVSAGPELSATVRLALRGLFYDISEPDHHALVYLNGNLIAEHQWNGTGEQIIEADVPQDYLLEGGNILTIESLLGTGAAYDLLLADWLEVDYWKVLAAEEDTLTFAEQVQGSVLFEIPGFSTRPRVFDITDPKDVTYMEDFSYAEERVTIQDDLDGWREYIVTTEDRMHSPETIEIDTPSHLSDPANQADYLIITAEEFTEAIQGLADFRRAGGLHTKVIRVQDIYDEFNGGIVSPHAIKDFLSHTYHTWQKPAPAYVLLVGDASYDYKDNMGYGRSNYIPTFMLWTPIMGETGSDSWYVQLDGQDDRLEDMFIGRIPARTAEEVYNVVTKTIGYEQASRLEIPPWAQRALLVADEDEPAFESISEEVSALLPPDYDARKLYLESYETPQALTQDLVDEINAGALILNYAGHGGIELWANEQILNIAHIQALQNQGRLPIVVSMTCLDGYYLHPFPYASMAESFLTMADGGAVAVWSPTGMGQSSGHAILSRGFYRAVFQKGNNTLGSAIHEAKVLLYEQSGDHYRDLLQTYTLFGDPALMLMMK